MAFEREFYDLMPQTLTYQAYSGLSTDGYATRSYSTGTQSVRCRVQAHRRTYRDISGREVTSTIKLLMAPYSTAGTSDTVTVQVLDKIILPAGFQVAGSCTPPIIEAYPVQDDLVHHHNEVVL